MTASSTKNQQLSFDPMLVGGDIFVLLSMQMASNPLSIVASRDLSPGLI